MSKFPMQIFLRSCKIFNPIFLQIQELYCTPPETELYDITGGSYYHFGMKSCVSQALASFDLSDQCHTNFNTVYVQINIDGHGLPIFKTLSVQVWPILGSIDAPVQSEPFIVGLFCGKSRSADVDK